eukprot:5214472-Prymnesium_polylepis.1
MREPLQISSCSTAGTCCMIESLSTSIFTIQASACWRTPSDLHIAIPERSSRGACVSTLLRSCATVTVDSE